jgi:AcrR family transcriptional regulator
MSMLAGVSDVNGQSRQSETHPTEPGEARSRRPKKDVVRRRLLDAALEVFAQRGFDTATLDEVAAAAGLSKGAIYSNFTSKDDLFFAMMTDQVSARVESVRTALATGEHDGKRLDLHHIGRLLTMALAEQREWRLVFIDFWSRALRDDEARVRFVAHRRAIREAIADGVQHILVEDQPPGEFTIDDVVTVVLALSNGLAIEQYIDPTSVSDDLFGRTLAQLSHPS